MTVSLHLDPVVIQQKYAEERDKRIRPDGLDQYVELEKSDKFRDLNNDPWVDHTALNAKPSPLRDGSHVKFLILGAGYGGLLMAARLIQSGFSAHDIRLVDNAGGFGGTWYWNRYPGLHCDVESYVYMPLLEETGYMPKRKYAPGVELLEHAERIAKQWNLRDKALFRASVHTCTWEDGKSAWSVSLTENRGPGAEPVSMAVTADFIVVASGIFPHPHIPKLDGLDKFKGNIFHTARWNYNVTGGSPSDPKLDLLKDKTVAIIGTGATAIQVVPRLAESCKQLLVFQRTPSSVDTRGQRDTDPDEWKTSIASSPGWQRQRQDNFNDFVTRSQGEGAVDLVGDGWSNVPAYCSLLGSTCKPPVTPDQIPEHIGWLYGLDLPHGERIRRRVDDVVTDKRVADSLKPWYPGWCKRPCFSDEYLQAFNRANVTLVDTAGLGVSSVTERGLVVDGVEYPVDVLVLSTGYTSPGKDSACPTVRTGIVVRGRGGIDFRDKWISGVATLYGNMTHRFPNLFLLGPGQAGSTANNVWMLDRLVENTAYIVSQATKRVGGSSGGRFMVEATQEAEEAWAMEIVKRAGWYAGVGGCTPGYLNAEGSHGKNVSSPEDMLRMARAAGWAEGPSSYAKVLEAWRAEGSMKGVEVTAV